MNVSKSMLLGVVLISLSTGLLIPQIFQVAITNFPLDEEGNLRVIQMNGDKNITITNFPRDLNVNIVHHTLDVTLATEGTVGTEWQTYTQDTYS